MLFLLFNFLYSILRYLEFIKLQVSLNFRTTLARWRAAKELESGEKERRPYLASECTDLNKCEKFRLEIIREISRKVSQIQNGIDKMMFL